MEANKSGLRPGVESVRSEDGAHEINHSNTQQFKCYFKKGRSVFRNQIRPAKSEFVINFNCPDKCIKNYIRLKV